MGNCLSSGANVDSGGRAAAEQKGLVRAAPVDGPTASTKAVPQPTPSPQPPQPTKQACVQEEVIDLDAAPEAITNPDTDMILNMLDPINGPAAGLPYQVHYLGPPRPPCEKERLATVHALGKINDNAAPDPEISSILKLVSAVFKAPATLCALFDEKRVFVSEQDGNVIPCGEFPWRWTLCGWSMAFKNPQVLVIQDTLEDARFSNNLKVTTFPKVRFYCGAPLVASNGQRLGTLCFADVKPRKFDRASCIIMNNMSELVVRQLEKGIALKLKEKDNKQLLETYKHLQRAVDCYEQCVVLLDTTETGWKVLYANASWVKQTGVAREKFVGGLLSDMIESTDGTQLPFPALIAAVEGLKTYHLKMARIKDPNVTKTFGLSFKPAGRTVMDDSTIPIGVPSFLSLDGEEVDSHRFYFMTIDMPGQQRSSQASSYMSPSNWIGSTMSSEGSESIMGGLELGHLLGRGSFGWVYYGTWFGTPVAVKVIDQDIRRPLNADGARAPGDGPHQEAVMALELRHPNIVATLKYAMHGIPKGRAPDLGDYFGNNELADLCQSEECNTVTHTPVPHSKTHSSTRMSANPLPSPGDHQAGKNWAVIEAPAEWDELSEGGDEDKDAAEMRTACQVKADGWQMDTNHSASCAAKDTPGLNTLNTGEYNASSNVNTSCANTSSSVLMQTWMVMEYCDKGCVQDAVDRGWLRDMRDCITSKPNMEAVIATAYEIASAMQYLHAHDIVHGDLSGWNVLLSSSGSTSSEGGRGWTAKVADFGLSRNMELQTRMTTKNYGTITHMPPELLTEGTMSMAVDIYSYGVLLWQMYTGSRPWSGLTHAQIILKVAKQHQGLGWDEMVPTAYKQLAMDCMAFDMSKRPSFASIVQQLNAMRQEN